MPPDLPKTSPQEGITVDGAGVNTASRLTSAASLVGPGTGPNPGFGLTFPTGQIRRVGKGPNTSSQVETKLGKNPFSSFEEPKTQRAPRPGLRSSISRNKAGGVAHSLPREAAPAEGGTSGGLGDRSPSRFRGWARESTARRDLTPDQRAAALRL